MNSVFVYSMVWPGFHCDVGWAERDRGEQLVVAVDHVHHHVMVFGEIGVVRDHELVGNVDRTAERRLGATQLHGRGRHRRCGGLFTPARGDKRERHSGGKQEQAGGAARNHKRLMIIARLPLLTPIC
jgi:hypothetical protein